MKKMAVITAFGGINSAGRSSGHHAFKRLVIDHLNPSEQLSTLNSLAQLMGLSQKTTIEAAWQTEIINGSLIRGWDNISWDANAVDFHQPFTDENGNQCWRLEHRRLAVQSAGQLPKGFDPASTYKSVHHPRGLQMAIYAISDALGQLGESWDKVREVIHPDQVSVYAGSAMSQLDSLGHGGMLQASLLGKRGSAKQCALGLSQMSADFINAYVLGSVGNTGSVTGACASFLYNLKLAVSDIQSGRARVAFVGTSEAPLFAEVVDGYNNMTALANESNLRKLDGLNDDQQPDFRRASRPFAENAGFTIAESAQFIMLTDDDLAMQLGLSIHGSVGEVFVNADGFKKSIANPGIGNYLTLGKAVAEAERWLGEEAVQKGSYVHAHGSSTPSNRTTESEIFSKLASVFNIRNWDITAVKSYLGHSIGSASGDQIITTLGSWAYGVIPGITSTHTIADDVHQNHLNFLLNHKEFSATEKPLAFINAKGFGGNNASAFLISPEKTKELIKDKYCAMQWQDYQAKNETVQARSKEWDTQTSLGNTQPAYHFGEGVLQPEDLILTKEKITLKGWRKAVDL